MNGDDNTGASGTLHIVATPIGNLADLSPRAADTLKNVQTIAAEDTRRAQILLQHIGAHSAVTSLHEHNEQQRLPNLIQQLQQGDDIALISDAGTPLISDPGYRLIDAARSAGIRVSPIPGPAALIAALSIAGLPTDRFHFDGFLPAKASQRRQRLHQLQTIAAQPNTVILYESSHRILAAVADIAQGFGPDHRLVICRELTKRYETSYRASASECLDWLQQDPNQQRGEFVILIDGIRRPNNDSPAELSDTTLAWLQALQGQLPDSALAKAAAQASGEKKRLIYQHLIKAS